VRARLRHRNVLHALSRTLLPHSDNDNLPFIAGAAAVTEFLVIPAIVESFLRNVEAGTIRLVS